MSRFGPGGHALSVPLTQTPIGVPCARCTVSIEETDDGVVMDIRQSRGPALLTLHRDCALEILFGWSGSPWMAANI